MAHFSSKLTLLAATSACFLACTVKTTELVTDFGDGGIFDPVTHDAGITSHADAGTTPHADASVTHQDASVPFSDGSANLPDATSAFDSAPPPPDDAAISSCVLSVTTGVNACDDCLQTSCCDLVNACFDGANSTDCQAIDTCVADCANIADQDAGVHCAQACLASHPQTADAYRAQLQCVANQCQTPCSG